MKLDDFNGLSPFEQAVILLLEKMARDIESIKKLGED
jgi:hypothetical protein